MYPESNFPSLSLNEVTIIASLNKYKNRPTLVKICKLHSVALRTKIKLLNLAPSYLPRCISHHALDPAHQHISTPASLYDTLLPYTVPLHIKFSWPEHFILLLFTSVTLRVHQITTQTPFPEGRLPWPLIKVNFPYYSSFINILLPQLCIAYLIIRWLMSVSPTGLLGLGGQRAILFCSLLYP